MEFVFLKVSISGPRQVLPAKVKENIRLKGSWIVEYMVPCDGEFEMKVSVDGIAAQVDLIIGRGRERNREWKMWKQRGILSKGETREKQKKKKKD